MKDYKEYKGRSGQQVQCTNCLFPSLSFNTIIRDFLRLSVSHETRSWLVYTEPRMRLRRFSSASEKVRCPGSSLLSFVDFVMVSRIITVVFIIDLSFLRIRGKYYKRVAICKRLTRIRMRFITPDTARLYLSVRTRNCSPPERKTRSSKRHDNHRADTLICNN